MMGFFRILKRKHIENSFKMFWAYKEYFINFKPYLSLKKGFTNRLWIGWGFSVIIKYLVINNAVALISPAKAKVIIFMLFS